VKVDSRGQAHFTLDFTAQFTSAQELEHLLPTGIQMMRKFYLDNYTAEQLQRRRGKNLGSYRKLRPLLFDCSVNLHRKAIFPPRMRRKAETGGRKQPTERGMCIGGTAGEGGLAGEGTLEMELQR
jgi:hypothetical protein